MSESAEPKTVDKEGVYVLPDGTPVRLKEGEPLPEGAEYRGEGEWSQGDPFAGGERAAEKAAAAEEAADPQAGTPPDPPAPPEERAKPAAPEDRAKSKPPENRSAGGR